MCLDMNLMRNPIVVIGLAAVALFLLVRSFRPMWQRGRPPAQTKSAPAQTRVAAPAQAPAASNSPGPPAARPHAEAAEPQRTIDLQQVGWSFNGAPRRDPFQVIRPGFADLARLYPPVSELFSLTAIWRQTDSSLAVVNYKIVAEGNTLVVPLESPTGNGGGNSALRFTIESIESDSIWLEGPGGREELKFGSVPVQTNIIAKVIR